MFWGKPASGLTAGTFPLCPHVAEKVTELPGASFIRAPVPFIRLCPHNLIVADMPHLLVPSSLAVEILAYEPPGGERPVRTQHWPNVTSSDHSPNVTPSVRFSHLSGADLATSSHYSGALSTLSWLLPSWPSVCQSSPGAWKQPEAGATFCLSLETQYPYSVPGIRLALNYVNKPQLLIIIKIAISIYLLDSLPSYFLNKPIKAAAEMHI